MRGAHAQGGFDATNKSSAYSPRLLGAVRKSSAYTRRLFGTASKSRHDVT